VIGSGDQHQLHVDAGFGEDSRRPPGVFWRHDRVIGTVDEEKRRLAAVHPGNGGCLLPDARYLSLTAAEVPRGIVVVNAREVVFSAVVKNPRQGDDAAEPPSFWWLGRATVQKTHSVLHGTEKGRKDPASGMSQCVDSPSVYTIGRHVLVCPGQSTERIPYGARVGLSGADPDEDDGVATSSEPSGDFHHVSPPVDRNQQRFLLPPGRLREEEVKCLRGVFGTKKDPLDHLKRNWGFLGALG
jgi:hypothetical protein